MTQYHSEGKFTRQNNTYIYIHKYKFTSRWKIETIQFVCSDPIHFLERSSQLQYSFRPYTNLFKNAENVMLGRLGSGITFLHGFEIVSESFQKELFDTRRTALKYR